MSPTAHWEALLPFFRQIGFRVKTKKEKTKQLDKLDSVFIYLFLAADARDLFWGSSSERNTDSERRSCIAGFYHDLLQCEEKNPWCSLKDLCIHTHSWISSCHRGFISSSLHTFKTQKWKEREKKKGKRKRNPSISHRSTFETGSF